MMGRNIDMIKMFGNFDVICPYCNHRIRASSTFLEDVDIDGSDFNPENGVWCVDMFCYENGCEKEFPLKLQITAKQVHSSASKARNENG